MVMTKDEFFEMRRDWLDVGVVRNASVQYGDSDPGGHGYDVVLRIDGAYMSKRDAEGVAEFFRKELKHLMLPKPVFLKDISRGD